MKAETQCEQKDFLKIINLCLPTSFFRIDQLSRPDEFLLVSQAITFLESLSSISSNSEPVNVTETKLSKCGKAFHWSFLSFLAIFFLGASGFFTIYCGTLDVDYWTFAGFFLFFSSMLISIVGKCTFLKSLLES